MWDQPREFPGPWASCPSYQTEGSHLFAVSAGEPSAQQDRGALSGRWFRQGLPQGPEGRPRRQDSDRGRGAVQGDGHHRSTPRSPSSRPRAPTSSCNFTTPKFATMAIKRNCRTRVESRYISSPRCLNSVSAVMAPAGAGKCGRRACRPGIVLKARGSAGRRPRGVPRMERLHGAICSELSARANGLAVLRLSALARTMVEVLRRSAATICPARKHHEAGPPRSRVCSFP